MTKRKRSGLLEAYELTAESVLAHLEAPHLVESDKMILLLHYGPEKLSIGKIAEQLGLSRTRIDQIHARAIRKIIPYALASVQASWPLKERSILVLRDLSRRICTVLMNAGIRTIDDLLRRSAPELLQIAFFGEASLAEVRKALSKKGLRLKGE